MTFDTVIFNSNSGRFLHPYTEASGNTYTVIVKNCTFNSGTAEKTALNIKDASNTYNVYFLGTNKITGTYKTDATTTSPMFMVQGTKANVYVGSDLDNVTEIWTNGAKTENYVDPNGYTPTPAAKNFYKDTDDANLWHIANLAGLQEFATAVNGGETYSGKTIVLDADIDLNNAAWTPISTSSDKGFKGTFDGNGKTISNFTITGTGEHVSFFGPSYAPTIKNLTFYNANVTGGDNAGIVVGYCATVSNVTVQNSTLTGAERVGAIAGGAYVTVDGCTVKNCTITGTEQVAAIEGYVCVSDITNNKSIDNTIIATSQRAGGIAGKLEVSGDNKGYMYCNGNTVTNTTIITPTSAGGLAGQMYGAGTNIENYQICNNTIDAVFYGYDATAADKKSSTQPTVINPVAPLRASSYTDFNSLINTNITGNSWTEQTYPLNYYTFTTAETGTTEVQIINNANPFSTGVAKIGDTNYATLAEAVAAATEGQTITLLADIDLTATQSIATSLTIDLNGHNISSTDCRALWQQEGTLTLTGEGTISAAHTAENTSFASSSSVIRVGDNAGTAAGIVVGENVTVSTDYCYGVTYFGTDAQTVTVNGTVAVTGEQSALSGNGTSTFGETTVTVNGTVSSENEYAIYHPEAGTLTINGTVTGKGGIEMKGGSLVVNSGATVTATATEQSHSTDNNGTSTSGYAIANVYNPNYKGNVTVSVDDNAKVTGVVATINDYVAKIGTTYYTTLAEALAAATEGQTVTLLADISLSKTDGVITFPATFKGTLDLNGHKIERLENNNYVLDIPSGADVTLVDKADTKGWIKGTPLAATNKVASLIRVKGKLTLDGAALISDYCCVKVDEDPGAGEFVMNSGSCEIIAYSGETVYQPSFAVMNWSKCTINGGTLNGNVQTLECKDNNASKYGETIINGGTFEPANLYFYVYDTDYAPNVTVASSVTGLTPAVQYSSSYAVAITTATNSDGSTTYSVTPAVAKIGTTNYATLTAALAAATEGQTITLLADVTAAGLSITKDLTLDLNGHKINAEGSTVSWATITNDATLTINGTTAGSTVYGRVNLGVSSNNNGNIVINGGTYACGDAQTCLHINGTCLNSNVTIKNATITSANDNGIQLNGKGEFVIDNCTITGATGIYIKAGTLTLSNSTVTGNKTPVDYSYNGNGANPTGDAIVVDACEYPGGNPTLNISSTTLSSTKNDVGYYQYDANGDGTTGSATVTSDVNTYSVAETYAWNPTDGVYTLVANAACNMLAYKGSASNTETVTTLARWNEIIAQYPNAVAIADATNAENVSLAKASKNIVLEYAVGSNGNKYYECSNFVLEDPATNRIGSYGDFYTPVDFTAVSGSYTRAFALASDGTARSNTCCLPFAVNTSMITAKILTFAYYEPIYDGTTKTDNCYVYFNNNESIDAGMPCMIYVETAQTLTANFNNTEIVANPLNSGNMKGSFATATYTGNYYGIDSTGKKLGNCNGKSQFAFRSVLGLDWSDMFNGGSNHSGGNNAKVLNIAIIGEDGEATAIDGTPIDNVVPGVKDGIYTINGVKVNEAKKSGLYIINGKKTFIK